MKHCSTRKTSLNLCANLSFPFWCTPYSLTFQPQSTTETGSVTTPVRVRSQGGGVRDRMSPLLKIIRFLNHTWRTSLLRPLPSTYCQDSIARNAAPAPRRSPRHVSNPPINILFFLSHTLSYRIVFLRKTKLPRRSRTNQTLTHLVNLLPPPLRALRNVTTISTTSVPKVNACCWAQHTNNWLAGMVVFGKGRAWNATCHLLLNRSIYCRCTTAKTCATGKVVTTLKPTKTCHTVIMLCALSAPFQVLKGAVFSVGSVEWMDYRRKLRIFCPRVIPVQCCCLPEPETLAFIYLYIIYIY
jgi:hypothetical protein